MSKKPDVGLTRRQFLGDAISVAAAASLGAVASPAGGSNALQGLVLAGYTGTDFIGTPDGCMWWGIVGVFVVYGEVFFVLTNYSPTALIEVHKHVGASIFYDAGGRDTATINQGVAGWRTEGGYEVRVWEILDGLRELMFTGYYDCICKPKQVPGQGSGDGTPASLQTDAGDRNKGNQACEFASQLVEGAVSQVLEQLDAELGDYLKLSYDSGIDAVNWRSGCRDFGTAFGQGLDVIKHCALRIPENVSWNDDPVCVGDWGPLMPRQMRADGASPPVVAAHLGYRAIHIAARETKKFPYPVHTKCKFQPVFPELKPTNCFFPGAGVGDVDRKATNKGEGKWGFIWWSPTGCVKASNELQSCFGS